MLSHKATRAELPEAGGFLFLKKKREQSLKANNGNGLKEIKISIEADPIDLPKKVCRFRSSPTICSEEKSGLSRR